MHLLLIGNYGVGNAGDEVLREYFLKRFPDVTWYVLSANPEAGEWPRFPSGLRSFLSFRWLKTLRAIRQSDGILFGGGTLFTDVESVRACWVWFLHAFVSHLCSKPILLAFQGIGPFRTRFGTWCARWVVRRAVFISVRDVQSACRIERWKKSTEIIQSADPSFLLLESEKPLERTKNVFTFIPRFSTGKMSGDVVISVLKSLQNQGATIRIISLQPEDERERKFCDVLSQLLGVEVLEAASLMEAMVLLPSSIVITERYHGAILAAAADLPFLALCEREGDKLHALANQCGQVSLQRRNLCVEDVLRVSWSEDEEVAGHNLTAMQEEVMRGEVALSNALALLNNV
jgi:polysaccharide pyruvyl transferase WcaK-like protein